MTQPPRAPEVEPPPAGEADGRGFDWLYSTHRGDLYRALVLITGNRDLATEAVDRGFRTWKQSLRPTSRRPEPPVEILGSAFGWARRKLGTAAGSTRGFRLPGPDVPANVAEMAASLDELLVDERAAVVGCYYLGWTDAEVGRLIGRDARPLLERGEASLGRSSAALAEGLTVLAGQYSEPLPRGDSVRTSALARRVGAFAAVGVGVVAAVAAIASAVPRLVADEAVEVAGPPSTVAIDEIPAEEIEWTQVALPIGHSEASSVAHGPEGFVIAAMDYSGPRPASRIIRSSDGLEWELLGGLDVAPNTFVHQVHATANRYIAVGSGFDERFGNDRPRVWTSVDGVEWVEAELPIEEQIEIGGQIIAVQTWVGSLAVSQDRLVLIGNQSANMDLQFLLRDALPDDVDMSSGWGTSPQGIEIYDRDGRATFKARWDELDIPAAIVRLVTGGRHIAWSSTDGETWTEHQIEVGNIGGGGVGGIAVAGKKAGALVWGEFGSSVWSTADFEEEDWNRPDIPGLVHAMAVASVNDKLLVVGASNEGANAVWVSDDGLAWNKVIVPALQGSIYNATSSGGVVTAFGDDTESNAIGPIQLDIPEGTLEITSNGQYTLTSGDGTVLVSTTEEQLGRDGDQIHLLDEEGNVLATVSREEIAAAWEGAWEFVPPRPGPPTRFVAFSRDGETWQRLNLEDSGTAFYPSAMAVGQGSIVVTGFQEGSGSGATAWVGSAGA